MAVSHEKIAADTQEATPKAAYRLLALVRGKPASPPIDPEDQVLTFPHLLGREVLAAMAVLIVLLVISLIWNAPLEELANPSRTPNPAKAPWYFAGLQELLVYFDPWIAGVVLPTIILAGLALIPYLDMAPQAGIGRWFSWSQCRFQVAVFAVGLGLWFILILIGTCFRGPAWEWYWPWESWDLHKESKLVLHSLSSPVGGPAMLAYLGGGLLLARHLFRRRFSSLPLLPYYLTSLLLLLGAAVPMKLIVRIAFHMKYVFHTPWFNV